MECRTWEAGKKCRVFSHTAIIYVSVYCSFVSLRIMLTSDGQPFCVPHRFLHTVSSVMVTFLVFFSSVTLKAILTENIFFVYGKYNTNKANSLVLE